MRIVVHGRACYFGYYRDKRDAVRVAERERARLMPFSIEGTRARALGHLGEAA